MLRRILHRCLAVLLGVAALAVPAVSRAQGIYAAGSGAMHRSMAGASTAAGVDALGAQFWNPAAMGWMESSEAVIGGEFLLPDIRVSSIAPANLNPFDAPSFSAGTTRSDSGLSMVPGIGVVMKHDGSPLTTGIALAAVGMGGVNFPGGTTNPVFNPTGPLGRFLLGPQASYMAIVSMMPNASLQLGDRLVVGFGAMIDAATVSFDPALFATPDDSNGDGLNTFPSATHSRPFWGGGFRAGLSYRLLDGLTAGLSYNSPHWFEAWRFNSRNEIGQAITVETTFSLPQILSAGLAWQPTERLLLSTDVRWLDYSTTKLLGQPAAEGGAGWRSIWACATGLRYQVTDSLSVQMGYLFNENPVPSRLAFLNILQPTVVMHTVSCGAYYQMNDNVGMSLAYIHGFNNAVEGSLVQATNTRTRLEMEYDSLAFGLHIRWGAPNKRDQVPAECCEAPAPACGTPSP